MEDFVFTKVSADGEWTNVNLSEMARLLEAQNPQAKIVTKGKEASSTVGMEKAQSDRRRIKGRH